MTEVLAHMIRQGCITEATGPFKRLIFIVCSIFSLVIVHYFCSLIKTELVTIQPPELFQSYQELVENQVGATFIRGFSHYLEFKFAPLGSPKKNLWNFSVKKHTEDKILMRTDHMQNFFDLIRGLVLRQMVLISDSTTMSFILREVCAITCDESKRIQTANLIQLTLDHLKKLSPIFMQDVTVRPKIKGFIFSEYFNGYALNVVRSRIIRHREVGLWIKMLKKVRGTRVVSQMMLPGVKSKEETYNEISKCAEGAIKIPDSHVSKVSMSNIENFILFFFLLLLFDTCVLFYEKIRKICFSLVKL